MSTQYFNTYSNPIIIMFISGRYFFLGEAGVKLLNDDEHQYESTGLWASQIIRLARQLIASTHKLQNKFQV
jgi:hypothetical protein